MAQNLQARLAAALTLAVAALETPGDLSEDEKRHVIEDGGRLLAELEQLPQDTPAVASRPVRVVIDLNGSVQQVTADGDVEVIVFDQALRALVKHDLVAWIDGEGNPMVPWLSPNHDPVLVANVFRQLRSQLQAAGWPGEKKADGPEKDPGKLIQELVDQQGWNDETLIILLKNFLGANQTACADFAAHLQSVADGENEAAEEETPPGQSCDDFEREFGEAIRAESGDYFEYEEVSGDDHDVHHVWTIVEGDNDTLWVLAGIHWVNRLGYIRTKKRWVTGDEQYRWDD